MIEEAFVTSPSTHDHGVYQDPAATADIPLLGGVQRQGDVLVLPVRAEAEAPVARAEDATALPADGLTIVRGEATNNTHVLIGDGTWVPSATTPGTSQDLGDLDVTTEVYLLHPEHGALGIAPGRYLLRRQREETPIGPRILAD